MEFLPVIFIVIGIIFFIKIIIDLVKKRKVILDIVIICVSIVLFFVTAVKAGSEIESSSSKNSNSSSIVKKSSLEKKSSTSSAKKASSISSTSSSSSVMSPSAVKEALKPLANDHNLVDSIKVNGFTTNGAGGAVIIKTTDYDNVISSDDIDEIIAKTCQLLAKNPQIIGTGLNIKITSYDVDNGNYVVTGYANVDSNQLANVNSDNVSDIVQDYQNKGN